MFLATIYEEQEDILRKSGSDLFYLVFFMVVTVVATLIPVRGKTSEVSYETLQAAYIHKFTNYIEWSANKKESFKIGVLNNSDAFLALKEELAGKMIDNRQVVVLDIKKIDKNNEYDILHISKMDESISKQMSDQSLTKTLFISQDPKGLNEHTLINFFMEDSGKLRFDINQNKASQLNIKINSRLLNLARKMK